MPDLYIFLIWHWSGRGSWKFWLLPFVSVETNPFLPRKSFKISCGWLFAEVRLMTHAKLVRSHGHYLEISKET